MFNRSLRSLVFFHVAKTGGTSATETLRPLFANTATEDGNLSARCLASHPGCDDVLYHGHPLHAVAERVPTRAVTATVLRAPAEQAVSNYLHLLRNPQLPLHADAVRLGFRGLLVKHPLLLAFQAVSLNVAISGEQIHAPAQLLRRLPAVTRFLDRIDVVGCLDQLDAVLRHAADLTGRPAGALHPAPFLNTAAEFGTEGREAYRLRSECQTLATFPMHRRLMEAEAMLVARVHARCAGLAPWRMPLIGVLQATVSGTFPLRSSQAR